ncbi:hypothetical protein SAMN05421743_101396 [Thalassobacillus cyri]|uniref:Uncharacterized protein n=1 Tax=Thalassobacillus cyri TaxID=571932 RepID=A0A1H3WDI0_9BACI|nr:hypothetical protein SAMN05421743_101396 [Thalassobacillus cyri]
MEKNQTTPGINVEQQVGTNSTMKPGYLVTNTKK